MINAERLLRGALRHGLRGSRRRSGLASLASSPMGGILGVGALGLAIAAYDHFTGKQVAPPAASAAGSTPPSPPRVDPPPPPPLRPERTEQELDREALLMVRAMVSAAQADGQMDDEERSAILKRISQEGLSGEEEEFLARELESPSDVQTLVASLESEDLRRQVYLVSLLSIAVDTPEEKSYLADLARRLRLPSDFLDSVHRSFGVEPFGSN